MKETANQTVGQTTDLAGKTANNKSFVAMVTEELHQVGTQFKATGGDFVKKEELMKFVDTTFALSKVGRYDEFITYGNVAYPITSYTIDAGFGKAFCMPRMITMPGTNPFTKDVREHEDATVKMTPAEYQAFQYQYFANFRKVPTLQPVTEFTRSVCIGEITEVSNGERVHIDDMCAVKSLPVQLTCVKELYEESYFVYPLSTVVKQVVVNFYTAMKK